MLQVLNRKRVLCLVAAAYLLSSFLHGPRGAEEMEGISHLRLGPFVLAPPMVLSGDPPHYLAAVNSLIEDADFDLSNNYQQAEAGGWDLGARFRGVPVDQFRHGELDSRGRLVGTHSPFLALLLAPLAWPLRETAWVESACIMATIGVGLLGIWWFGRWLKRDFCTPDRSGESSAAFFMLLLALATPLWCYSRDFWPEPWVMTAWVGLLHFQNLYALAALAILGTAVKFPFVLVPLTMGALALRKGRRRRGWYLCGASMAALGLVIGMTQYLFRDVDHFSLFHVGFHAGFDWPFDGIVGLFLGPENGILPFFPFLAWGIWQYRRGGELYLPAAAFFLVHAAHEHWGAGTGFSARYLTPMLPVMVLAVQQAAPKGKLFRTSVIYSLFWGAFAGLFPALLYDRSIWGVFEHIWRNLGRLC